MSEMHLYYGPETCARVTMTALEEIGRPFSATKVDLAKSEHKSPGYLAINPNGEVPALAVGTQVLTQNAAILHYLNDAFPEAGLLPASGGSVGLNAPLSDLLWCSSTLHILRRQVLNPGRFSATAVDGIRQKGLEAWQTVLPRIALRLGGQPWWYGDAWSIVDTYLNWCFSGLMSAWLDLPRWPALVDHEHRVQARPCFVRALNRERDGAGAPGNLAAVMPPGYLGDIGR